MCDLVRLFPRCRLWIGLFLIGLCASLAHADEFSPWLRQQMHEKLHQPDAEVLRGLSGQDRLVLSAALFLREGKAQEALRVIGTRGEEDPLLAVLAAEAHRRLALRAIEKVGRYGKGLRAQRERLASIDLTPGLAEAWARLRALARKIEGRRGVPLDILRLGPSVKNVFVVDKARSRLYVYHADADGHLVLDADEYVVTGSQPGDKHSQGDKRTPNGVYRLVQRLDDPALRARYGPLAFPLDYPNALDRLHGKTGSGIWLHGYQQDAARRPPQDTLGCVALPNARLLHLAPLVRLHHSWMLIGEQIAMGPEQERQARGAGVLGMLQQWADDWSSRDHARYIAHYDESFHSGRHDLQSWSRYKKRVNGRKSFIHVEISDITLIHDPQPQAEGEVVVAEFRQVYRSSNLNSTGRKRLYLVRRNADAPWRILIEESVPSYD